MVEWCCCVCLWLGMEFEPPTSPSAPARHHSRRDLRDLTVDNHSHHSHTMSRPHSRSHSPHPHLHRSAGDLVHIPGSGTITIKRTASLKSDRLLMASACVGGSTGRIAPLSPTLTLLDDMLPPPPLPPANSVLRKQVWCLVSLHQIFLTIMYYICLKLEHSQQTYMISKLLFVPVPV